MDPRVIYCGPFFAAALFIFIVALFAFRRRRVRGGWYLTLVCLSGAVWAATEGLLYLGLGLRTNLLRTYIQYLGVAPESGPPARNRRRHCPAGMDGPLAPSDLLQSL